jgi:crotonobetaine/carnitine-CoA ligase
MKQAARHGCSVANLFAAPIRMILAQPQDPADGSSMLRLVTFAQSVTPAHLDEWRRRYGAPLVQIFGLTEAVGMVTANPIDGVIDNMSVGLPALGYECRIVDRLGRDVAAGAPGELLVRGEPGLAIMKEYINDPAATSEAVRDGWLRTGDLVEQTPEGYIRFVDRAKDMIKRAGENVASGEVEMVLLQHPSVAEAAVIGVPDAIRDEAIKAIIVLEKGRAATEDEIIEFCRRRLSRFRVPEIVEFRPDLPRTSVGKVKKYLLRREESASRSGPASPAAN